MSATSEVQAMFEQTRADLDEARVGHGLPRRGEEEIDGRRDTEALWRYIADLENRLTVTVVAATVMGGRRER